MKKNSSKTTDFNFLLDEFFIYHGLDDIEKDSENQDNELESMMQICYKLLKDIYKMQSKINKDQEINKIKNISIISRNTYNPQELKKIFIKKSIKSNKSVNSLNKINNFNTFNMNKSSNKKKDLKKIEIIPLLNKYNKENKSLNISYNLKYIKNNYLKNVKKQYSPNYKNKKEKQINNEKSNLKNNNIIKINKLTENNKKIIKKNSKISLLD